jgi:hypothetical protein
MASSRYETSVVTSSLKRECFAVLVLKRFHTERLRFRMTLSFPHGSLGLIPLVLCVVSFILSVLANARCNLVKPNVLDWFDWIAIAPDSIGLWCAQDNGGETTSLQDEEFDSKYQAARGLGTTVLVFGTLLMIIYLVAAVKHLNGKVFFVLGLTCILTCCLFQGLVFLIFKSEVCGAFGCSLDTGGKIGIAACVGWFLTGIASMMLAGAQGGETEGGGRS